MRRAAPAAGLPVDIQVIGQRAWVDDVVMVPVDGAVGRADVGYAVAGPVPQGQAPSRAANPGVFHQGILHQGRQFSRRVIQRAVHPDVGRVVRDSGHSPGGTAVVEHVEVIHDAEVIGLAVVVICPTMMQVEGVAQLMHQGCRHLITDFIIR